MGTNGSLRWMFVIPFAFVAVESVAQGDLEGAKDHPTIPRVDGTYIVGYAVSSYDEGRFVVGMENRELQTVSAEGIRTRIMYFGTPDMSPLFLVRNYQTAFGKLGDVEEKFTCRQNECYSNFPTVFIWNPENRIASSLGGNTNYIYGNTRYFRDQIYWYGTITSDDRQFHVSAFSAVFTDTNQVAKVRGIPAVHLEVVEVEDFEPDLVTVTSEEIASAIQNEGHIALYGIYFDLDSASLRGESEASLAEIASALKADLELKLYVVGHTDNQGTLAYNQDLSQRRAQSVVDALRSRHGIEGERLVAIGAGLSAPKQSNDTEEGRALNRRVELVKM